MPILNRKKGYQGDALYLNLALYISNHQNHIIRGRKILT